MTTPRLPRLHFEPFAPPVEQVDRSTAPTTHATTGEVFGGVLPEWPSVEIPLCQSSLDGPTGVDVFVKPNPVPSLVPQVNGWVTVRVYGITRGVRALLQTGRLLVSPTNGAVLSIRPDPVWIVAVRAIPERYEVTIAWHQLSTIPTVGTLAWAVTVRHDSTFDDVSDHVGTHTAPMNSGFGIVPVAGPVDVVPSGLELRSLRVVNATAGIRYIHVVDWDSGTLGLPTAALLAAAPIAPVATFVLTTLADRGIAYSDPLAGFRAQNTMVVAAATTPNNLAGLVADCRIGVTIR